MPKHIVKCTVCKQEFDTNEEEFIKTGATRYAHKECIENRDFKKTPEEKDYEALCDYIKKLFGQDYINVKVDKQLRDFKKTYNYSYSGMLKTLTYWYQVKGNDVSMSNGGIGIIPWIYDEAYNYYYTLFKIHNLNADKEIKKLYKQRVDIVITSPRAKTKKQIFSLEEGLDG